MKVFQSIREWFAITELRFAVYRKKYWWRVEWRFSGVTQTPSGHYKDSGVIVSPHPMRRSEAIAYALKLSPGATILHVDDWHRIISFRS